MTTYKVSEFPYTKMSLGKPNALQGGGSYFTKLTIDEKPIYLQMPKCETKNGVIETKRQKYIDMMYTRETENDLANWIECLENQCQELINVKKDTWFSNDITREDLESMMTPISRLYKSGTKILVRGYIDLDKKGPICKIYDEKETIRTLSDIDVTTKIIPLIQIEGIKFTSRSFDIELKLIQILILDETTNTTPSIFCLIKNKEYTPDKQGKKEEADKVSQNKEQATQDKTVREKQDEIHKHIEQSSQKKISTKKSNIKEYTDEQDTDEQDTDEQDRDGQDTDGQDTDEQDTDEQDTDEQDTDEQDTDEQDIELNCIEVLPNLDKKKYLEEVILNISDEEPIKLKNKNDVYKEIYRAALEKAKHMRNVAIQAFLEAKQIKTRYLLSDLDDSDESEISDFSERN